MESNKEFAVKSDSFALYEAFKKDCEEIGWKWESGVLSPCLLNAFGKFFFSKTKFYNHGFLISQCTKIFNLGFQYSEALTYAKKIVEESKKKELTYDDVAKELFYNKNVFYTESTGGINSGYANPEDPNNSTTSLQLEKLLAINKMMNVAVYLNPKKEKTDWSIKINQEGNVAVNIGCSDVGQVRFASKELAQQAISILGEDVIRLALS